MTKGKQVAVFPMVLFIMLFKVVLSFYAVDRSLCVAIERKVIHAGLFAAGAVCFSF